MSLTSHKNRVMPKAVKQQYELGRKHRYEYREIENGNIENNSTLYIKSDVARSSQIEQMMDDAIQRAKKMPHIFGSDFECTYRINVVRRHTGEYVGYSFMDVDNPKFYYALIGLNVDGSERSIYIDDPSWMKKEEDPNTTSWYEMSQRAIPPKIKRELPPLIQLGEYEYDQEQQEHFQHEATHGSVSLSPAFITPSARENHDDRSLYVTEIPAYDPDFLYTLFARYARYSTTNWNDRQFYPKISIRKCNNNQSSMYAIVSYEHPYDAAFALSMMQKVRAKYNDEDVVMPVRYALKTRR